MKIGFIKLHRKIVEWEWYDNTNVVRVFIHLLLSANHEKNQWHGIDIGVGEVITGRESLAKTLGLSQQSIRTALDKLKSTNEITIKSTNKYSIIKLNNWSSYQGQSTSKTINKQPTTNQQSTTLKEVKNEKNIRTLAKANGETEYGNPDVNKIIESLKQEFELPALDGSAAENRKYAWLAIKKCNGIDGVLKIIKLAAADSFYGDKISNVKKLYYHMVEIVQKARGINKEVKNKVAPAYANIKNN